MVTTPQPQQAQGATDRLLTVPAYPVRWIWLLLVVNALAFLGMTAAGGSQRTAVLVQFGAKVNALIVQGQYWRLLTACFLHIGLAHLLVNCYALWGVGATIELRLGGPRFVTLYLLSGVAGTALSLVGSRALSAGASGAIFGLLGATIVYYATYRAHFGPMGGRTLGRLLGVAGLNLAVGFVIPGIDYLGHIGGLLAGLALGWGLCPRYRVAVDPAAGPRLVDVPAEGRALVAVAGVLLAIVACVSFASLA
jgi:membrane associated rhomboid family serine protease